MDTDKDYKNKMMIPSIILTSVFNLRESVAKIVNIYRGTVLFWGCNPEVNNSPGIPWRAEYWG